MTPALRTERLVASASARSQAVADVSARAPAGRPPRADRAQRRGQDHAHQPAHRACSRRARARSTSGTSASRRCAQHPRVKRGLTRTFQINTLFPGLTVLESVVLAILRARGPRRALAGAGGALPRADRRGDGAARDAAARGGRGQRTAQLPYGRQRLVEIALALATRPRILLLDEPAAGIPAARERRGVRRHRGAARVDVTILFIEHDMGLVFRFAERITVLVAGRVLTEGTPAEIAARRAGARGLPGTRGWLSCWRSKAWRRATANRSCWTTPACARRGRAGRAAGAQWRGQDDAPHDAGRAHAAASREPALAGRGDGALARVSPCPRGHRLGAAGAWHVALAHRRRAPELRCAPRAVDPRARAGALPAPRGAPRAPRQPALGRRAADARDRPGARSPTPPCCCWTSRWRAWRPSWSRSSRACCAG